MPLVVDSGGAAYRLRAVPFGTIAADHGLLSVPSFVVAVAVAETAGAAAELDLLNGTDANGELLIPLRLAASSTTLAGVGVPGVPFDSGIFLHVAAGSVKGSVTVATPVAVGG